MYENLLLDIHEFGTPDVFRTEDLFRSIEDAEYQRQLLVEYGMEG